MNSPSAVSAGHPVTADTAELILREGGNAIDAAVAAFFAACVAEPVLASVGGGGFASVTPAGQRTRVLDFFARTPAVRPPAHDLSVHNTIVDFGSASQGFHIGMGTVAVPGAVAGMLSLHADIGRMPITDVMAPAVTLAREGVAINALQALIMRSVEPILTAGAGVSAQYTDSQGALCGEGAVLANERFADLCESLALEGADLFYRGEIASEMSRLSDSAGGALTYADLAAYEPRIREPLKVPVGNAILETPGAPAAGGMLIGFGMAVLNDVPDIRLLDGPARASVLLDVMQATATARTEACAGNDWPDMGVLLGDEMLEQWRELVSRRSAAFRGTTHINVADAMGNHVSVTVSNGEGSGELVAGGGFMLNNFLGEDDLNPRGLNQWTPGVPMTSMMAPSVLRYPDGRCVLLGSGGSSRIRTAMLQVIDAMEYQSLGCEDAVSAPRLHVEGTTLFLEAGLREDTVAMATRRFEDVQQFDELNFFFGGVHVLDVRPTGIDGAGDPRRGGVARVFPT